MLGSELECLTQVVPSAFRYKTQKVYLVNLSNVHIQGIVDYLVVQDNPAKRWLINYITVGETRLNATNMSNVVYVLELENKTTTQIQDEVSALISATKD